MPLVQPFCSNFRMITGNFSGVQIFRIFTVNTLFALLCFGFRPRVFYLWVYRKFLEKLLFGGRDKNRNIRIKTSSQENYKNKKSRPLKIFF